jgi:O-methyltransferase domain/Dimerisation domain
MNPRKGYGRPASSSKRTGRKRRATGYERPRAAGARQPDDRRLWEILAGIWSYPAFLVAHQIKLFDLLAERSLTLAEIGGAKSLQRRPAEALLALCASLGFIEKARDRYALTPLARTYLLESSPAYFGYFLDGMTQLFPLFSVESIRRAVDTDSPQSDLATAQDQFAALGWHAERAQTLTRAMHSLSVGPAMAWPAKLDLSKNRLMLDVGGGSGAHAIGAVSRWRKLRAIVMDVAPVCEVAREFAERAGMATRISTHVADMWSEPFPGADLHFYSMIFHDWPPDKCRFLARKSFEALPSRGRIVVHEILFNNERTGPFVAAGFNVNMLTLMKGEQYSGREISAFLGDAGFKRIQVKPTFGYWSIVTGTKP